MLRQYLTICLYANGLNMYSISLPLRVDNINYGIFHAMAANHEFRSGQFSPAVPNDSAIPLA
jgi:hypothetical protein